MNLENLEKIATLLESDEVAGHFNMADWFCYKGSEHPVGVQQVTHSCGSYACIGGYCELIMKDEGDIRSYIGSKDTLEWLGLNETNKEHRNLFFPYSHHIHLDNPKLAAKVVRNLMTTGIVDWSIIDGEV